MSKVKRALPLTESQAEKANFVLPAPGKIPESQNLHIWPDAGLKAQHWYVVEVAYSSHNPVFLSLLYAGLLEDGSNEPGSYAGIVNPTSESEWEAWGRVKPYYLRVQRDLGKLLSVPEARKAMKETN